MPRQTMPMTPDESTAAALGRRRAQRRSGAERFHRGGQPRNFDVLGFWQWSASDLLSNAMRGVLAEYIVAQALAEKVSAVDAASPGAERAEEQSRDPSRERSRQPSPTAPDTGVRDEWASYDLVTADGVTVEVKSAAYLQSWHQERLSTITFSVRPSQGWSADTGRFEAERRRQADVYVFALLAHKDKATVDPLDLGQWEFYVVATARLEECVAKQRSLGLGALQKLTTAVGFDGLANAVRDAAGLQG